MNKRSFLHCLAAGAAAPLAPAAGRSSDSVSRFLEAYREVGRQWIRPRGSRSVEELAYHAITGSHRVSGFPGYVAFEEQLRQAILTEAARSGGYASDFQQSTVAELALTRLMDSLDPWSSYMNRQDWDQYQASRNPSYCGVGMDLEKEEDGSFTCWPYPESSAERAGVKSGARLIEVDNHRVEGRSIFSVGSMIRGKEGRAVYLKFAGLLPGIGGRLVPVVRQRSRERTVFAYSGRYGTGLRISRFTPGTPSELRSEIRSRGLASIELDLRDCRGGDLDAAVACAGLFLRAGTTVASIVRQRGGNEVLRTTGGSPLDTGLQILQNGNTASSAEVFIQALTSRQRAVSRGSTSNGKGTTQSVIQLANGGALVLTTGRLVGAGGQSWHRTGLRPTA